MPLAPLLPPYNTPLSIGIPAGGLRLACACPLWQGRARKRAILGERDLPLL